MQCSKCGFVMSELDAECLRCKRLGERGGVVAAPAATVSTAIAPAAAVEEKECPRCGKATRISASVCDKCGYEYQPDSSRAERYQALLAQETQAAPPDALRRTVPPAVSWGIIAACLLVVGGAGWGMFGGSLTGSSAEATMDSPIIVSHHHPSRPPAGYQNVTYSVTGTAALALITYKDAKGAVVSLPSAVSLPWTQIVKAKPGSHLSLSAAPLGQSGTVAVAIGVDGVVQKQSETPGADGQVTVEDAI